MDRSGFAPLEQLEQRQVLALTGVTVTQFPRIAYDVTGAATYDAGSQAFDVLATPTSIRFSAITAPVSILPVTPPDGHGDVAIHALVDSSGALIGGVAGDDFVLRGTIDSNGNGIADPGETTGVLLSGEIYAFGHLDSGGPTDAFDFRFVPTGGALLSSWPAGRDIGITMTSEHSDFVGVFSSSFSGGAKGTIAPINAPAAAAVSGTVYCDRDLSGSHTLGDVGIGGVQVFLTGTNHAGQAVNLSTFTNADGTYAFAGLRPGTYTISEVSPADAAEGSNTVGSAGGDVLDQDSIGNIVLAAGVDATGYNFGYICDGSLSGFKYTDITGNGLTADDTPLGGTTIYIDANDNGALDPGEASTVTGPDGSYSFENLDVGTYIVREVVPAGYVATGPAGGFHSVSVQPGQNAGERNFANTQLGSIAGAKFLDITGNGLSGDDTPLGGVTVYIDANNNGALDSGEAFTSTAGDGSYAFTGLMPGTYIIREVVGAGFVRTTPSPADNYSVVLVSGTNSTGNNFANYQPPQLGRITGTKWFDATGNGQSADDAPLGGTTIYIDLNNNGVKNSGEPSTVTDADGSFAFENLSPGTYIVREVVPSDMIRTGPVLTDKYTVTVGAGQTITGIDFTNADKSCCACSLSNVQYWVNGVLKSDLRGNTNAGDTVEVIFTIPAGSGEYVFTLVSYTAPSSTFVAADAYLQRIYDIDTGLFGPGTHTLTVQIPDSFYQVDFVCGEAIDVFGPAGSNIFYTPQCRLISADNDGNCALRADSASISGIVWFDQNEDGVFDADEIPIQGAKIQVSWVQNGSTRSVTRYTNANGEYVVGNLNPDYSYKVTETQPSGFAEGDEFVGSSGGSISSNRISNISLSANENATGYNFSEFVGGDVLGSKDIAAVSFWTKSNGQNLIKSLNGSASAQRLGAWLAETFPNLFGAGAGSYNLDGKTNSQIASAIISRAANSATKLEAEVLAAALSIYVTNSAYAGGTMASSFGFRVNLAGSGFSTYNTGTSGSLLGLANNTTQILFDLLSGANDAASNGIIHSGNASARTNLYNYFRAMNAVGGIK